MAVVGPTQTAITDIEDRWSGHPHLARLVRIAITAVPIALSWLVTLLCTRVLPPEKVGIPLLLWWIVVLSVATVVLVGTERFARRALPLVTLLKLALIFPDRAPSRFGLALRTGTTKQLERRLEELDEQGADDVERPYTETMLQMVSQLNKHDRLTRGHCERVRGYTDLIVEEMGLDDDAANKLRWAALLHDVGKLMVPYEILNKRTRPDEAEWEILKSHTTEGRKLIEPIAEWLGEWADAVDQHHERWDGGGYPYGLSGTDIHLGGRIVAVADAFDVMTSTRSYKKPMPAAAAREEIARCASTQFDPVVVRAFLNIGIGRLKVSLGPLAWLANLPIIGSQIGGAIAPGFATAAAVLAPVAPGVVDAVTFTEPVDGGVARITVTTTSPEAAVASPNPGLEAPNSTTTRSVEAPQAQTSPTTPVETVPSPPRTAPATSATPAPVSVTASPATATGNEDSSIPVVLTATSTTSSIVVNIVSQPAHGAVTLTGAIATAPNGTLIQNATYVPQGNYFGSDSFTFTACSGSVCSTATASVSVTNVNDAPLASDVAASVALRGVINLDLATVLSDVDGDVLSVAVGSPSSGTASSAGTTVQYTSGNTAGVATIPFTVNDGHGGSTTGVVRVFVNPPLSVSNTQYSSGRPLNGASVSGIIFVWADLGSTAGALSSTSFALDGALVNADGSYPFDFATADPWGGSYNTSGLTNGPHSITATFTATNGTTSSTTSTFTVAN